MALQFSTTLRNTMLDQIESTAGVSAKMNIFTGAAPANCSVAESGTLLVQYPLASDWASAAASGAKAFSGVPLSANAVNAGTAAHFRLYDTANSVCTMQGTVTATGGDGDLTLDNTSIASGQTVQITSWTITAPGA